MDHRKFLTEALGSESKVDDLLAAVAATADVVPPDAPRKEFVHAGQRFMVIELMWHWELRWEDPADGSWRAISDEEALEQLEARMPGLEAAYSRAVDEADAAREAGPADGGSN